MSNYTYRILTQRDDEERITDLLLAVKDELLLPDREAAQRVTNLLFEKGGVVGGYHGTQLGGILGYFWGDPNEDFTDKRVVFFYVGAILDPYRLTRMFHNGLSFTLKELQTAGAREIRLQAEAANPYTNKLYGRFARPVAEGKSLRGVPVITYVASLTDALNYLCRGRRSDKTATSPRTVGRPVQFAFN